MSVNMPHQIMRIRAVSLLIRTAIHTPRQTSQLARTARHRSCSAGRFIFFSTRPSTKPLMGSASSRPARTTMTANSTLPMRLPIQVQIQLLSRSLSVAFLLKTPSVSTRLLPVKSSDPAKITMVSAPPKQMPMVMRTAPGLSLDREPPMVKIRTMAAPTYMPASIDRTRWPGNERLCPASLAAAWSPRVKTDSVYKLMLHVLSSQRINPGSSAQSEPRMCHIIGACQPLSIPKRTDHSRINGHTGACSAHGEEREGEEGKPWLNFLLEVLKFPIRALGAPLPRF